MYFMCVTQVCTSICCIVFLFTSDINTSFANQCLNRQLLEDRNFRMFSLLLVQFDLCKVELLRLHDAPDVKKLSESQVLGNSSCYCIAFHLLHNIMSARIFFCHFLNCCGCYCCFFYSDFLLIVCGVCYLFQYLFQLQIVCYISFIMLKTMNCFKMNVSLVV